MMRILFVAAASLLLCGAASAQADPAERRLEPGKDEIARPVFRKPDPVAERAQNLKDATRIAELAAALREEIRKSSPHVVSAVAAKEAAEIEKLIRQVRARMK